MVQDVSPSATLRVAFVTGGLRLGGATTFICNLAGELIHRNVAVNVLSFEIENPLASDFESLNIPVTCYDENQLIYEDRIHSILTKLAEFRPTVVLANLGATSFEVLRYLPQGVFRIAIVHSDDSNVYKAMLDYSPYLDAIAAVSKKIESEVKTILGSKSVPVLHLPLGVPMPEITFIDRDETKRPLRILYLGRLDQEQKRVRLFPTILEQLKSTGMPFSWTIIGDGPDRKFLEQAMKSSPEQTVSLLGKISYTDVPQYLREHDVFFLASDYEGLPLSLLEAMGHGLVPVVSDLPSGIGEVVDETNGIRVKPHNIEGYAQAIFWLHEHREEMKRMSQAARKKVEQDFSVNAMADRWVKLFTRAESSQAHWPNQWEIQPILNSPQPFYYSQPIRMIRRLAKKF